MTEPNRAQAETREAHRVTLIGAVIDTLLGIAKVIVGYLVGSAALVADGIHSFSDLATDTFVLVAMHYGRQAPDRNHPYGHGRIETLATLLLARAALLLALALGFRGLYGAAAHLVGVLLLTSASVTLLKNGLAVERPSLVDIPPSSFAYPSGHAAGITVFMGLAAAFVAREWRPSRRWWVYLAFSVPMVLVAFSRVVLGVHWFSDIPTHRC